MAGLETRHIQRVYVRINHGCSLICLGAAVRKQGWLGYMPLTLFDTPLPLLYTSAARKLPTSRSHVETRKVCFPVSVYSMSTLFIIGTSYAHKKQLRHKKKREPPPPPQERPVRLPNKIRANIKRLQLQRLPNPEIHFPKGLTKPPNQSKDQRRKKYKGYQPLFRARYDILAP